MNNHDASTTPSLRRSLSLTMIMLYGLGTILGAGIYVLIGEVVREAGVHAPVAFLLAATIAGFTAFSYAELSSRIPRSAGEAVYVQEAFSRDWLASLVGWAVVVIGIVSAATITRGFVGYANLYVSISPAWIISALVLSLGLLAAWGIRETAWTAVVITIVEVAGLLLVIAIAATRLPEVDLSRLDLVPSASIGAWTGVLTGAFLAFYAFIGFEDMVNVAEEVKEPRRTLPKAIILALFISTFLYMLVALGAVLTVPVDALIGSDAPLAAVLAVAGFDERLSIGIIGMVAVVNGALIQIVMASRVLYGMGDNNLAIPQLAKINPRTRTPLLATTLVTLVVLALALWLPLVSLARLTSFVTLIVFALVNAALWWMKRTPDEPPVSYPRWVPMTGAVLCVLMLALQVVPG